MKKIFASFVVIIFAGLLSTSLMTVFSENSGKLPLNGSYIKYPYLPY